MKADYIAINYKNSALITFKIEVADITNNLIALVHYKSLLIKNKELSLS